MLSSKLGEKQLDVSAMSFASAGAVLRVDVCKADSHIQIEIVMCQPNEPAGHI